MGRMYFHVYANGSDAKNFITTEEEFKAAVNRVGLCAHVTGATVVSFSIEDSHPHFLLWCTPEECAGFKRLYESLTSRSIIHRRGSLDGVQLHLEHEVVENESYLMNVAVYTVFQPTKDGKAVMPFDYPYGSGPLYFRAPGAVMPWRIDKEGRVHNPIRFGSLTYREQRALCRSRQNVPDDWLVCNGFILPSNYIDVGRFERIYKTHNCYRVFLGRSKKQDEEIMMRMAERSGVCLEDSEARRICAEVCMTMFSRQTTRTLEVTSRLALAQRLRREYRLSLRQLSGLVHIPEAELDKYVK